MERGFKTGGVRKRFCGVQCVGHGLVGLDVLNFLG